jgi:monoamine oxidase
MNGSSITRRQFLLRVGAAGGSTAVFSAMNALELMGAPVGARPDWSGHPPRNTRVIVLGAGLTGLATGYELGKLGYDYQILEARDRVGGVNHTIRRGTQETELTGESQVCNFDQGQYLNGGPWRIPHTHTAVTNYCKELGVPLQVFINETDASYIYHEDPEIGPLSGKRVRLREVKSDLRGYSAELLAKAVDQGKLDLPLSVEDQARLVDYLVIEGYLNSTDRVYRGGNQRGAEGTFDLSELLRSGFGNRLRSVDGGFNRSPMFQPVGGMDQIPMGFQRAIGDRITLNAAVDSIHQTEDGVRIVYGDRRTGQKHEVTADYVVSCMPLSILRKLDVDLSPEMKDAINLVRYSSSAKIGVQMRRRFWEEDDGIFGGAAYTNLPLGQFAYPSNDFYGQKGVILGFYGNAAVGGIGDNPIAGRIEHVIANASKFHPQMREEFETGYAVFWDRIQFSEGAYANNPGPLLDQITRPDRRIYLGCAAASTMPAWMEGAFGAAWGAVDRLHKRVMAG